MSWYADGNWNAVDGSGIANVLADLANGVNERYEAIGQSRISWTVNTGTMADPVLGSKSETVTANDFHGLDFGRCGKILQSIFSALESVLIGNIATRGYSGWATTPTGTGLAADDEIWDHESIVSDAGMPDPGDPDDLLTVWDQNVIDYCREALSRMLYPVVYPRMDYSYVHHYRRIEDREYYDLGPLPMEPPGTPHPIVVWPYLWSYEPSWDRPDFYAADTAFDALYQGVQLYSSLSDTYVNLRVDGSYNASELTVKYSASANTRFHYCLRPMHSYPGTISKAYLGLFGAIDHAGSPVVVTALGGSIELVGGNFQIGQTGFGPMLFHDMEVDGGEISLSTGTEFDLVLEMPDSNPFNDSRVFSGQTIEGEGMVYVEATCERNTESGPLAILPFNPTGRGNVTGGKTRLIVDMTEVFTRK